ncbi:MAG: ribbon-helix-helix domain-containing protein [Thermoanaerobaculia bacterium]
MSLARVTVTLPGDLVAEMDRAAPNRSRFVLEAVTRELGRRRRAALRLSLSSPHPDALVVAEAGVGEWGRSLPAEDAEGLLEPSQGKRLRWAPGKGWKER